VQLARLKYPNILPGIGARPQRWTVSCGGFDRLPGVIILNCAGLR
jgi:hypothetical protein